jgi:hypothetical protein
MAAGRDRDCHECQIRTASHDGFAVDEGPTFPIIGLAEKEESVRRGIDISNDTPVGLIRADQVDFRRRVARRDADKELESVRRTSGLPNQRFGHQPTALTMHAVSIFNGRFSDQRTKIRL